MGSDKKTETLVLRLEDLATAADVEAAEAERAAVLAEWTAKFNLKKNDDKAKDELDDFLGDMTASIARISS